MQGQPGVTERDRWPTCLGWLITAVWILCTGSYAYWRGLESLLCLPPNELGDFVAGATTPIALLWLIVGYFLQRKELGLQREEVHRLADETERQRVAIEANEQHARRDTFMRYSELILEELNALCADAVNYGGLDSDRHLQQFLGGNTTVYIKILLECIVEAVDSREQNSIKHPNLRQKLENRLKSYHELYSKLLVEANKADRSGDFKRVLQISIRGKLFEAICGEFGLPASPDRGNG